MKVGVERASRDDNIQGIIAVACAPVSSNIKDKAREMTIQMFLRARCLWWVQLLYKFP